MLHLTLSSECDIPEPVYTYVNEMYINMSIFVYNTNGHWAKDVESMSDDIMIRVPRELKNRFASLSKKDSWKGFASFVREAIRIHLEHHEEIDRSNNRSS